MNTTYIQDQQFNTINFHTDPILPGDYENCTFESSTFTNVNLSGFNFDECEFRNCDFSNAKTTNTAFRNVKFNNCKLIGLQFNECNPFLLAFQFIGCQLNLSSFYQQKIKGTFFKDCILHEVDFTETQLSGSTFSNCDFSGAIFENTILEKTDFRTSFNFSIDPETNRIKLAKFSMSGVAGLLDKYHIRIV